MNCTFNQWYSSKYYHSDNMFEYTDNPEKLKEIMKETEIKWAITAIEKSSIQKNSKNFLYEIRVIRGEIQIIFDYHGSIHDYNALKVNTIKSMKQRKAIQKDMPYNILCCMGADALTETDTFQDFCDCFGYDSDSITDRRLYLDVCDQKAKIKSLFSESELEAFPC